MATYIKRQEVTMTDRERAPEIEAKAPRSLETQVFLNLIKTEEEKSEGVRALLKAQGLSAPQYNVLRILRGAGGDGLGCQQISERMVTRLPDITRLLDRLESAGLVSRERGLDDRRIVRTRITDQGRELLLSLDAPVAELHRSQFAGLSREELLEFDALLEKARRS
jgi:DNA-binding MarR family transcriptional regulator